MRVSILVVLALVTTLGVVSVFGRQSTLAPLSLKLQAKSQSQTEVIIDQAPAARKAQSFGTCFVAHINHCSAESTAWSGTTEMVIKGEPSQKQYAANVAAEGSATLTFALEMEAQTGGCTGQCQNPSLACSTGYVHGLWRWKRCVLSGC